VEIVTDITAKTLANGRMIPSITNNPPAEVIDPVMVMKMRICFSNKKLHLNIGKTNNLMSLVSHI
jgi:hypothetical protein